MYINIITIMDLTQQKLVKSEWEFLEVPVDAKEKNILNIIYNAYGNTGYSQNDSMSLLGFMKIASEDDSFHFYQLKLKNKQRKRKQLKKQI